FAQDRTDIYGYPLTYGNLTGYNWHFARYGALTQATPDGRVAGSALLFGSGQSEGKDQDGATSQLLAVAHMDPTGIMCGDSIMNLSVEEETVQNDASFDKLVSLVETYFQAGGLHLQLNHVSHEDLLAAKSDPDKYKSLRVRVSGFSATFVKLDERLQDNVIARTEYHL
ncbi:MAG: glycine radical domain-containing protein, partial [Bacteroidales bacterium]|nr:glycine radical domain-containing protein [Bacteroidales bacterium]